MTEGESTPRPSLTSSQARAVRAAAEVIDGLLGDIDALLVPVDSPWRRSVDDLSRNQKQVLGAYVRSIHFRMADLLAGLGPAAPRPAGSACAVAMSALEFAEITLQDIAPERLRGYGALSGESQQAVEAMLPDVSAAVVGARHFLSAPGDTDLAARIARLPATVVEREALSQLEAAIRTRGLVGLRKPTQALLEQLESGTYEIAVFGRVSSGKSSLLNAILEMPVLPVGITPVTVVPTRVVWGAPPMTRVRIVGAVEDQRISTDAIADFVTEELNPGNAKHVVRVTVQLDIDRLRAGMALVDTPGLGALASAGARETYAYMPRCDLGVIVIDGSAPVEEGDLELARTLEQSGIELEIVLSKADRVAVQDRTALTECVCAQLANKLDVARAVRWVSSVASHAALTRAWFDEVLAPRIVRSRDLQEASARRKLRILQRMLDESEKPRPRGPKADAATQAAIDRIAADAACLVEKQRRACEDVIAHVGEGALEIVRSAAAELRSGGRSASDVGGRALAHCADRFRDAVGAILLQTRDELRACVTRVAELSTADLDPHVLSIDLTGAPLLQPPPELATLRIALPRWPGRERRIARRLAERAGPSLQAALRGFEKALRQWARSAFARLSDQLASEVDPWRTGSLRTWTMAVAPEPRPANDASNAMVDVGKDRSMLASEPSCLFCQVVAHQTPAQIVHETESVLAFQDIQPVAPTHVLVVPKKHVTRVADAQPEDALLLGQVLLAGAHVAQELGIAAAGYRLVFNNGRLGGEHISHVHQHVLGGRRMRWPPG